MSQGRLFELLCLLLERGRMTAPQLAEHFEVSVRTIYRDIDALSAAGVPVYSAPGKGGGVSLLEGYTLHRAAFTEEEQQLLLTALRSLPGDAGQGTAETLSKLSWLGISGIANVLCCIKMAKYYELTEDDVVVTVLTDSAVMYGSRIQELNDQYGAYNAHEAAMDHALHMLGLKLDNMQELTYADRKRVHNLKYYTWVEQQGKTVEELNALWYDTEGTWDTVHAQAKDLDDLINAFNEATGLLKDL